jgi:hypothetical protein
MNKKLGPDGSAPSREHALLAGAALAIGLRLAQSPIPVFRTSASAPLAQGGDPIQNALSSPKVTRCISRSPV